MDTNQLLHEHGISSKTVDNYPAIAKHAAELASDGFGVKHIIEHIRSQYVVNDKVTMVASRDYMDCVVFGKELIEQNAIEQMDTVMRIPPAVAGALMPDAHLGYGMPIGGVVALENAVSPNFVGFDIACRMKLTLFDLEVDAFDEDSWLAGLRKVTNFGVGGRFAREQRRDHVVMQDERWGRLGIDKDKGWAQLGTSGKGNHFADIVLTDYISNAGQARRYLGLLTHSGSRGSGYGVARKYGKLAIAETDKIAYNIPKGYAWLRMDTDPGREYWAAMSLMGDYAQANHDVIHREFMWAMCLKPALTYDNHHNFAWQEGDQYIHRKGATPAARSAYGIIPGTSGSYSYVVQGLGNPASLMSAPHGAGRPYSRTEAKGRHNVEQFKDHMDEFGTRHKGITGDETVFAYKDIEAVMAASHALVTPWLQLKPLVVLMGGGQR